MTIALYGIGAAYVRVSTDHQDTERQRASIQAFVKRAGASIKSGNWFEDHGWARDTADKRPRFQEMIQEVEAGLIDWIVVDKLKRFGTKDEFHLIAYLHRLREAGCKLYDSSGKDWLAEDDVATVVNAVLEGNQSKKDQIELSHNVLGGKAAKASEGEWQGEPPCFGLDVACYDRVTGEERWRVVYDGDRKRCKLYPDGSAERFDGEKNSPTHQPATEVRRLTPTNDTATLDAVRALFKRYATESISFTALGHWLNENGWRTPSGGNRFQSNHVERMLAHPIYVGHYVWNRGHYGKFHKWSDGGQVLELNYEQKASRNDAKDWIRSHRLFTPIVPPEVWDAVQRKMAGETRRTNAPRTARLHLSGLIYCGNCGRKMVWHTNGYVCGSYNKACREDRRAESPCERNSVPVEVLDGLVENYLDDVGKRIDVVLDGVDPAVGRLEAMEEADWRTFRDGIGRLTGHLAEHCSDEYGELLREQHEGQLSTDDFVAECVELYEERFDASAIIERRDSLTVELDERVERLMTVDLSPRAKALAKKKLVDIESELASLESQLDHLGETVSRSYEEMHQLQIDIVQARTAVRSERGERAQRVRAEALRSVVGRIECEFHATGKKRPSSRLVAVTIHPIDGSAVTFPVDAEGSRAERCSTRAPIPA